MRPTDGHAHRRQARDRFPFHSYRVVIGLPQKRVIAPPDQIITCALIFVASFPNTSSAPLPETRFRWWSQMQSQYCHQCDAYTQMWMTPRALDQQHCAV